MRPISKYAEDSKNQEQEFKEYIRHCEDKWKVKGHNNTISSSQQVQRNSISPKSIKETKQNQSNSRL